MKNKQWQEARIAFTTRNMISSTQNLDAVFHMSSPRKFFTFTRNQLIEGHSPGLITHYLYAALSTEKLLFFQINVNMRVVWKYFEFYKQMNALL